MASSEGEQKFVVPTASKGGWSLGCKGLRRSKRNRNPSAPKEAKQPKKRKDPNAPKAVSNAYMIFCKEMRSKLKEEFPELPFGQLGAKLGQMWRAFTPDEKKPYEDKASEDRERYRKEMEDYQTNLGSQQDQMLKKERTDENGMLSDDTPTEHQIPAPESIQIACGVLAISPLAKKATIEELRKRLRGLVSDVELLQRRGMMKVLLVTLNDDVGITQIKKLFPDSDVEDTSSAAIQRLRMLYKNNSPVNARGVKDMIDTLESHFDSKMRVVQEEVLHLKGQVGFLTTAVGRAFGVTQEIILANFLFDVLVESGFRTLYPEWNSPRLDGRTALSSGQIMKLCDGDPDKEAVAYKHIADVLQLDGQSYFRALAKYNGKRKVHAHDSRLFSECDVLRAVQNLPVDNDSDFVKEVFEHKFMKPFHVAEEEHSYELASKNERDVDQNYFGSCICKNNTKHY